MANEIQVTPEGFVKLKKELEELKGPIRMNNAEAIREAKAHGDLRENAAYHEAKLNQTRLESRIAELEKIVQLAKVVQPIKDGSAHLGCNVKLLDQEFDDEFMVRLVGDFEADADQSLISISSLLGQGLRGKRVGEVVVVDAPAGRTEYKIVSIE